MRRRPGTGVGLKDASTIAAEYCTTVAVGLRRVAPPADAKPKPVAVGPVVDADHQVEGRRAEDGQPTWPG